MGYRSNVVIVVYGEAEKVDAFWAMLNLSHKEQLSKWTEWRPDAFKVLRLAEDEKVLQFEVEDVKWYDGYADVDWMNDIYTQMAETSGLTWEQVRVGEESDDISHISGGEHIQWLLSTVTEITKDYSDAE